jgi:hypothetical protein
LLRILDSHRGAGNPIGYERIARQMGLLRSNGERPSPRHVKALVKSLIEDFRVPVGGRRGAPGDALTGYFLIVTSEDREIALLPIISEIKSLARRARKLSNPQQVRELLGQLALELNQEDAA